MIKQAKKQLLMAAAMATLGLTASASFAKDVVVDTKGEVPYVIDARNVVARSGFDLCWRTGYWTPAAAANTMAGELPVGCECDKDVVPQEKCVAAAAPAAAGGAGEPAEEEEVSNEVDVILESAGDKKIQVIKEVRALTSLGLKEAKDLVDGAPKAALEKVTREAAAKAKEALEAAGAAVSVK